MWTDGPCLCVSHLPILGTCGGLRLNSSSRCCSLRCRCCSHDYLVCVRLYERWRKYHLDWPRSMFRVWTMCSRLVASCVGLIAPLSLFAFRMTWPAVCQLDGLSTLSMWSGFSRYAHITGLPIPMDVFTVGAWPKGNMGAARGLHPRGLVRSSGYPRL